MDKLNNKLNDINNKLDHLNDYIKSLGGKDEKGHVVLVHNRVGSNIGWNPEVLRGRASGAERVESTNEEYTNGTEAKESQQVTFFTLFWIHDSQPNIFPDSFHLHSSVKSPHII